MRMDLASGVGYSRLEQWINEVGLWECVARVNTSRADSLLVAKLLQSTYYARFIPAQIALSLIGALLVALYLVAVVRYPPRGPLQ